MVNVLVTPPGQPISSRQHRMKEVQLVSSLNEKRFSASALKFITIDTCVACFSKATRRNYAEPSVSSAPGKQPDSIHSHEGQRFVIQAAITKDPMMAPSGMTSTNMPTKDMAER